MRTISLSGGEKTDPRAGSPQSTGQLPDFLIIGAAKSGTTSLHTYLARHPGVHVSDPKEPCYFSDDENYARGETWYRELFATGSAGQICGEASTRYTRWPHTADAAARIATALPDVRMIYLLRHPVDRAYSHYRHHMREGVTETFEAALERSQEYVDCSMYMRQIRRYLRFFEPERIKVIFADDLRSDPSGTLADVQCFLQIEARNLAAEGTVHENAAASEHYVRHQVSQRLKSVPLATSIRRALPGALRTQAFRLVRRSGYARRMATESRPPPMKPETRRRLLRVFAEPNSELEEFAGRDLSIWSK